MVQPQFGYRPPSWLSDATQATRDFFEQQQRENAAQQALVSGIRFLPPILRQGVQLTPFGRRYAWEKKLPGIVGDVARRTFDWASEALAPLAGQPVEMAAPSSFGGVVGPAPFGGFLGPEFQEAPTFRESPVGKVLARAIEPTISQAKAEFGWAGDVASGLAGRTFDLLESRVAPETPAYETGEALTQRVLKPIAEPTLEAIEEGYEKVLKPGFETMRAAWPIEYEGPSLSDYWARDKISPSSLIDFMKEGKYSLSFDAYLDHSEKTGGARREDLDLGLLGKIEDIPIVNPQAALSNIRNLTQPAVAYAMGAMKQILPDKILTSVDDRIIAEPGTVRHRKISDEVTKRQVQKGAPLTPSEIRTVGEELYPLPPGIRAIGEEVPLMFPALTGAKGLAMLKGLRTGSTLRPATWAPGVFAQSPRAAGSKGARTLLEFTPTGPGTLAARGPVGAKIATAIRGGIKVAEQPLRPIAALESGLEAAVKIPFRGVAKGYKWGIVPLLNKKSVSKDIDNMIGVANRDIADKVLTPEGVPITPKVALPQTNHSAADLFSLQWFDDAGNRILRGVAKLSDDGTELVRDKSVPLPKNMKFALYSRHAPLEVTDANLTNPVGEIHLPMKAAEGAPDLPAGLQKETSDAILIEDARAMFETEVLNVPVIDFSPAGLAPAQERYLTKAIIPIWGRKAGVKFIDETNRLFDIYQESAAKGVDFPMEELSKRIHLGSRSPKLGDNIVENAVDEMVPDNSAASKERSYSNDHPEYFDLAMDETTVDGQYLKLKKTQGGRETLAVDEHAARLRSQFAKKIRTIPFKGGAEADGQITKFARAIKGPKVATLYAKLMITINDDKWALRQMNDMYDAAVRNNEALRTKHDGAWVKMPEHGGEALLIRQLTLSGGRAKRAEVRVLNHMKTEVQAVLRGDAEVDDVALLVMARRYDEISKLPIPAERLAFAKIELDSGKLLGARPIDVKTHKAKKGVNKDVERYRAKLSKDKKRFDVEGVGKGGWKTWEAELKNILSAEEFKSVEIAANNTADYHAILRRELYDNEMISKELYDNWNNNHRYYFPLNYLEIIDEAASKTNKPFKIKSSGQVHFEFKELAVAKETSSTFDRLTAISPYAEKGLLQNTLYHETRLGRQKVARTFLHMARTLELGIHDVTDDFYKTVIVPEQKAKPAVMKKVAGNLEEIEPAVEAVPEHSVLKAIRPLYDDKTGTGFIAVYINGEKRVFGTRTAQGKIAPVSRDWFNPLFGRGGLIEHGDIPQMSALAWTNRFLKGTYTTYDPLFMVGNLLIDAFTVGVTARILPTRIAMRLVDDVFRAIGKTPDQRYARIREVRELIGADQARLAKTTTRIRALEEDLIKYGHDARVVLPDKNLNKWLGSTNLGKARAVGGKGLKFVKYPLDYLERLGGRIESYPREAVFDKSFVNIVGRMEADRILNLPADEFNQVLKGKVIRGDDGSVSHIKGWNRVYDVDGSLMRPEDAQLIKAKKKPIGVKQIANPEDPTSELVLMNSPEAKQAGVLSLDASVNFGRGGSAIKFLNNYIMFLNAALEGTKLPLRALGFNALTPNIQLTFETEASKMLASRSVVPKKVTDLWKLDKPPIYYESIRKPVARLRYEALEVHRGEGLLAQGFRVPTRGPSGSEFAALRGRPPKSIAVEKDITRVAVIPKLQDTRLPGIKSTRTFSIDDRAQTALTLGTMLAGYTAVQVNNFQNPAYWDTDPRHRATTMMWMLDSDPEIRDEQTGRPTPRYLVIPHRIREFAGIFGPWNYLLEQMWLGQFGDTVLEEGEDASSVTDFRTFLAALFREVSPIQGDWWKPQAYNIAEEVITGQDSYFDTPIVNKEYEKLPPSQQYNQYSNTALKFMSERFSDWGGIGSTVQAINERDLNTIQRTLLESKRDEEANEEARIRYEEGIGFPGPMDALKYLQSPPRFEHLYSSIFGGIGQRIAGPADYASKMISEWWYQDKDRPFANVSLEERKWREIARNYRTMSKVKQSEHRAGLNKRDEKLLDDELRNPQQYVDPVPEGESGRELARIPGDVAVHGTRLVPRFYKERGGGKKKINRAQAIRKWGDTINLDEQAKAGRELYEHKRKKKYDQQELDKLFAAYKQGINNGMTPQVYVESSKVIKKSFKDRQLDIAADFPRSVYALDQSAKNEWYTDMYGLSNFYPDAQGQVNYLVTAYYAIPTPEDDPSRTWRETYQDRDDFRDALAEEFTLDDMEMFDAALMRDLTSEQRIRAEQMRYLADYFDLGSTLSALIGAEEAAKLGPAIAKRWRDYLVAPKDAADAVEKGLIGTPTKEEIYEQYREIRYLVAERKRQRRILIYEDWQRHKREGILPEGQQPVMDLLLVLWYGEKTGGNPYEPISTIGRQYRLNLHGH